MSGVHREGDNPPETLEAVADIVENALNEERDKKDLNDILDEALKEVKNSELKEEFDKRYDEVKPKKQSSDSDLLLRELLNIRFSIANVSQSVLDSRTEMSTMESKILTKATSNGDTADKINGKHNKRTMLLYILFLILGIFLGIFGLVTYPHWSPFVDKITSTLNNLSKFIPLFKN